MRQSARERAQQQRLNRIVEIVCVAVVLLAILALVVWIATNSGGGVLNQG